MTLSDLIKVYVGNQPIPITSGLLIERGFEHHQGLIIDSYSIDVTGVTMAKSETLELSVNNDRVGYWYVYFRQGDEIAKENFHKNDLVLLRRDLQYLHELELLMLSLTSKEL